MAFSDSMFSFEILLKDFKSYTPWKELQVIIQFSSLFKIPLKIPTIFYSKKIRTTKVNEKRKFKKGKLSVTKPESKIKIDTGETVLIIKKSSELLSHIKKYPLEIIITKGNSYDKNLGSTFIPWGYEFINYLKKNKESPTSPPASMEGKYNVYNEITSQVIATIDVSVKLFYLDNKSISDLMSIISYKPNYLINTEKYEALKVEHEKENTEKMLNKSISLKSKPNKRMNISNASRLSCIRSDLNVSYKYNKSIVSIKSCSSFQNKQQTNLYRYIFGDPNGLYGSKIYQVGYFTVDPDGSNQSVPKDNPNVHSSEKSSVGTKKLTFNKCASECENKKESDSDIMIDLPEEVAHLTSVTKCKDIKCDNKKHRELPSQPDNRILLDVTNMTSDCCATIKQEIENVEGVITRMKIGHDPCFCTCECGLFISTKKTTYCTTCGGYEIAGDDINHKIVQETPIPCPIYHKLVDKNKLKTWSTSGSESKKKMDEQKSLKGGSGHKVTDNKRQTNNEKKIIESEKSKKKNKDDRFKFNYGYKGIPPQIGHSQCAMPCTGTLDNVPKRMGWLWSAENVLGLKFRPLWQPGAINKHVLRLLRMARHPGQVIAKKKRKDMGKKKRPLKRPLLVVQKKDGEYTVTMETMKTFSKPRALNQQPYEDKPVVTYTIGRTDDENRERLKKKERVQKRLERAQRQFIQSAFRNMCHEICLKTYRQALGILPDAEDPECLCYPALPTAKDTNLGLSCSCSEDNSSFVDSDTDSDEWLVEFTPPNALYDPNYKGKKVLKADNGSQYTYLDYKVKLVDRFGNPVPRYFKGPDGKQQCSDLGGFWSPDHKWLEINVDGYIAPDSRWAPMNFIGPNREQVDAYDGKFQAMNGKWLVVGVDGFVDCQGKWKFYPKAAGSFKRRHVGAPKGKKATTGEKITDKKVWSCFGDASPRQLSELGILGHGEDRRLLLMRLQKMLECGEDVTLPTPSLVFRLPSKARRIGNRTKFSQRFVNGYKCQHPVPSDKGIVAVDDRGRKTYFRLKDHKNRRPNERMALLTEQGISLSSFHVPCFHSFINSEVMKQQQRERLL